MAQTLTQVQLFKGGNQVATLSPKDFQGDVTLAIVNNKLSFTGTLKNENFTTAFDAASVIYKDGAVAKTSANGPATLQDSILNLEGVGAEASTINVGFNGKLEIGEVNDDGTMKGAAVKLSVRIGNMNKDNDWIIDFSDKKDEKDEGSKINVTKLLQWIGKKQGDTFKLEKPDAGDLKIMEDGQESSKDIADFEIEFKEFYINVTKKKFNFNIQSASDTAITLGNFTIKEVGFILTNDLDKQEQKTLEA